MLNWDNTQMLKKFFQTKKTLQKMHSFFFFQLQLITVLHLICCLYTSWSTTFISLKVCVTFSIFNSTFIFVFIKAYSFVQQKDHNSVQNKKSIKSNHSFAHRPLTFKMQPEVMIPVWVAAPQKLIWRQYFQTWKFQVLSMSLLLQL